MKKWILTASKNASEIDFETVIESDTEPGFWRCYDIATEKECEFFYVDEMEG